MMNHHEQKHTARYWSKGRFALLVIWLVALVTIPRLLEHYAWIPEGTMVIPSLLIGAILPMILSSKAAFQLGMVIVICCSGFSLYKPVFLEDFASGMDSKIEDTFFNIRGPLQPSGQVAIVDIDYQSLQEIGQWPWPRTEIAKVIRNLKEDGARVVGFDIVFAEPDRLSLKNWKERLQVTEGERQTARSDETSELTLSEDVVKKVVLRDWEVYLNKKNAEFSVNENLDPASREALIIQEYLRDRKRSWETEEEHALHRAERAEIAYNKRVYHPPENPLAEMTRFSRELFFIDHSHSSDGTSSIIWDNDLALGQAFRDGKVVAGGLFITPTSAGSRVTQYREREALKESDGMVMSSGIMGAAEVFPRMRLALEQVLNVPKLQEYSYHQGMFNIVPDRSGAARYYTMIMQAPVFEETLVLKADKQDVSGEDLFAPENYESKIISQIFTYPSISLEMLVAANGYDVIEPGYQGDDRGLFLRRQRGFHYEEDNYGKIDRSKPSPYFSKAAFSNLLPEELFIPLDYKGDLQINFYGYGGRWQPEYREGPDHYFSYYSISDVIQKRFEPGAFKDKYVLIGSTDATLSDLVGSPFRPAFPGLEVHATILDNLITDSYLMMYQEKSVTATFLGLLLGGALLVAAIAYSNAWKSVFFTLFVLAGLPVVSYWSFSQIHAVVNFAYPWLCLLITSFSVIMINYFIEGRDRRFVTSQFSQMVSGDVLTKLKEDPEAVSLKGQKADVSVLFSDIRSFTTISESLSPERLVELLNDYLTPMSDIIMENHGFIDKFIGDAIMACWGVPYSDDQHAVRACRAAIEQQKALIEKVAPELKEKYGVDIYVRIGISTGIASAALMGSNHKKNYTVMGDVVNLGARLEPACKDYDVRILICEKTYLEAKDHIEARCVDRLVVKGKKIPIPVYELMGLKGEVPAEEQKKISIFENALEAHWERNWDQAIASLREIEGLDKGDGPTHNLLERIENYQKSPPPPEWHGEFVKTSK